MFMQMDCAFHRHDFFQFRAFIDNLQYLIILFLVTHENDLHLRIVNNKLGLFGGVRSINRYGDGTHLQCTDVGDRPTRHIMRENTNFILNINMIC